MELAVVAIFTVLAYMFIGGMVGRTAYALARRRCEMCIAERRGEPHADCLSDHNAMGFMTGAFWPLALPLVAGIAVGARVSSEKHLSRYERKVAAATELIEAESERERLAIAQAKLNIEFLEKNGVHADVAGLFEDAEFDGKKHCLFTPGEEMKSLEATGKPAPYSARPGSHVTNEPTRS